MKPIYGTQFHSEMSPEAFPDGRKVLQNFFRIARDYGRIKGSNRRYGRG